MPDSQFAFDERDEALLAVVERQPATCHPTDTADPPLEFSTIPEGAFSNGPWLASRAVGALLPAPPGGREGGLQLQYTDRFVVYGGAQGAWRAMWPRYRGPFEASGVVVVPIASPTDAAILPLLHSVERLELLGRNAVAFGYSNERDFAASTIRLGPRAEVASTVSLPGVGTSEGRSHAFNALVGPNDVGMFGLPTIRWEEFERHSGEPREFVDFFGVDSAAHATSVGALVASGQNADASYECAVSCIDWYGNARPIFFRGRVFALIGLTAIEGVLRNGQMSTLAELNLTSPIGTNAVTPRYD